MYSLVSEVFPSEFHNIKIQSNSNYFHIEFQIGTITDETHIVHNAKNPIEELIDKLRDYQDNSQKIYKLG